VSEAAHIRWEWVAAAVACDVVSYVCQGVRWTFLLSPLGRLSWFRVTQAIYAGLFTNEILPMRFGELVRAYLVSRRLSVGFVSVLPSMAVERLLDGFWLAIAIGLTSLFIPLPQDLLDAADVLGIVVFVATCLFLILVFRRKDAILGLGNRRFHWKPLERAFRFLARLVVGFRDIGGVRILYPALLFSFLLLFMQAAAFWLVMTAYGMRLSFWVGAAVLLIVHFGTAIPNAPSNIGTYQFFTVLGLSFFGIDKTTAAGFSMAVFIILTVPLWVLGLLAINGSGLSLRSIRGEIRRILSSENPATPSPDSSIAP
jgi:hypothetical protein